MIKGFVLVLAFLVLAPIALSVTEPSVDFTSFACDDSGVLSFRMDYKWTGYKGGYVYLKNVGVEASKKDESKSVKGNWFKFGNKAFLMSEIKLESPTAYFFSSKNSLNEGAYSIIISYAVTKGGYERFKKQFKGGVICPKMKVEMEEPEVKIPAKPAAEEQLVAEERPKAPAENPELEEPKSYFMYYVIGSLAVVIIITCFIIKGSYQRPAHVKKEPSTKDVAKLFERKV